MPFAKSEVWLPGQLPEMNTVLNVFYTEFSTGVGTIADRKKY